ncbi:FKBP-type peptidyl-prolyl cis-trans isomerase [Gulosibacter sp. 10]|uniref:FKBP-type peptidyl-prolyl cis-trans isomerase n=1 Tax=Gulosibacter sp. 10 TaxID=1255570 RepID=UPI00097F05CD|nr:hypothetical protein [Gulosibacter sp. 10]SJM52851.1 FKBP-type peptidyl-prolyl cis-trans isomerases 1 [Gulosibacter sp. 10]
MTLAGFRKTAAAALSAGALIALSACAQIPASERVENCSPTEAFPVTHTGEGSGSVIDENAIAEFTFSVTGVDGSEFIPTVPGYQQDGESMPVNLNILGSFPMNAYGQTTSLEGVAEALRCAQSGQHVEATMTLGQLVGEAQSEGAPEEALAQEVVVAADVDRVYHSAATGRISPQQNGIPAVVTAPDGTPGVTMPQEPSPEELRVATTIRGFGPEVQEGDELTLHLSAFDWETSGQLLSTWGNPGPALQFAAGAEDGIYGISEHLIGAPVGSQVVIVAPASTFAGEQTAYSSALDTGAAVVFVIDILGAE